MRKQLNCFVSATILLEVCVMQKTCFAKLISHFCSLIDVHLLLRSKFVYIPPFLWVPDSVFSSPFLLITSNHSNIWNDFSSLCRFSYCKQFRWPHIIICLGFILSCYLYFLILKSWLGGYNEKAAVLSVLNEHPT